MPSSNALGRGETLQLVRNKRSEAFGAAWAEVYDECFQLEPTEQAVSRLQAYAGASGPALELGVGTGRLALPLARLGIEMHGIDASGEMLEKLAQKPGGSRIRTYRGDFRDFEVERRVRLVFAALSTFFQLADQDAQLSCLRCARRAMAPGGRLVLETFLPTERLLGTCGRTVVHGTVGKRLVTSMSVHDPDEQVITTVYRVLEGPRTNEYPVRFRYVLPEQLDAMAATAGLRLTERFADWAGTPVFAGMDKQVAIYKPASEGDSSAATHGTPV